MLFCRLLNFFKIHFLKNSFRNTIRVSKSLDPDQARCSVGPDLVPNCLQKLSADDTRRQRVNNNILPVAVEAVVSSVKAPRGLQSACPHFGLPSGSDGTSTTPLLCHLGNKHIVVRLLASVIFQ